METIHRKCIHFFPASISRKMPLTSTRDFLIIYKERIAGNKHLIVCGIETKRSEIVNEDSNFQLYTYVKWNFQLELSQGRKTQHVVLTWLSNHFCCSTRKYVSKTFRTYQKTFSEKLTHGRAESVPHGFQFAGGLAKQTREQGKTKQGKGTLRARNTAGRSCDNPRPLTFNWERFSRIAGAQPNGGGRGRRRSRMEPEAPESFSLSNE